MFGRRGLDVSVGGAGSAFSIAPTVIYQPRGKMLLLLLISVMFVVIGVWGWMTDGKPMLLVCAVFFGLGVVVFGINIVAPGKLVIDRTGITQTMLFRTHRLGWADVAFFRPVKIRQTTMIGFDYTAGYQGKGRRMSAINQALAGCDGALPGSWTKSAAEVCSLLNDASARWAP